MGFCKPYLDFDVVSGSDNGDIVVRSCVDGQDIVVLDGHRAATGITALQKVKFKIILYTLYYIPGNSRKGFG